MDSFGGGDSAHSPVGQVGCDRKHQFRRMGLAANDELEQSDAYSATDPYREGRSEAADAWRQGQQAFAGAGSSCAS